MLEFDEELKKFTPSLEVEEIEQAVYKENIADLTDIMKELLEQKK